MEEGDVSSSEGSRTTCIFFVEFGKKTYVLNSKAGNGRVL